jgi:4-hydroxy-tetrahydrodipicolinate synthase
MQTLGEKLGQIIITLATSIKDDEKQDVNYKATAALADHVIQKDYCNSLLVAGTSGEFYTLTLEERFELFRVVKDETAGRVPVMVGSCAGSTREAVQLARKAEQLGCDAVMVLGPNYCRQT